MTNDLNVHEVALAPSIPASSRRRVWFFSHAQKKTNWFDKLLSDAYRHEFTRVLLFHLNNLNNALVGATKRADERPLQLSPLVGS